MVDPRNAGNHQADRRQSWQRRCLGILISEVAHGGLGNDRLIRGGLEVRIQFAGLFLPI